MAGIKPAMSKNERKSGIGGLLQRRNDRAETHFLGKAVRGLLLLLGKGRNQRARVLLPSTTEARPVYVRAAPKGGR